MVRMWPPLPTRSAMTQSGESEYAINRTPVRLRDVQNLFYDTGIGKQSYSIISQGEVDAVLSSNSDERRALFEEVAGINKYKHRKKEALQKAGANAAEFAARQRHHRGIGVATRPAERAIGEGPAIPGDQ